MANPDSSKVSAMKPLATGGVLVAPYLDDGSNLPPKTPSGPVELDSSFVGLGYLAQDSNVSSSEEASSSDANAWGGALVLTVASTRKETFAFKPIEQNIEVWKLRYGSDNVEGDDENAVITHNGASFAELHSVVVAEKLGDGRVHLTVYPKAKLENTDSIEHSDSAPYGYGMTFVALAYDGDDTSYEIYYTPEDVDTTTTTTTTTS